MKLQGNVNQSSLCNTNYSVVSVEKRCVAKSVSSMREPLL